MKIKEQTEPYQKKVRAKHKAMKIKLIGLGKNKKREKSWETPDFERTKSAPPIGEQMCLKKEDKLFKKKIKVKVSKRKEELLDEGFGEWVSGIAQKFKSSTLGKKIGNWLSPKIKAMLPTSPKLPAAKAQVGTPTTSQAQTKVSAPAQQAQQKPPGLTAKEKKERDKVFKAIEDLKSLTSSSLDPEKIANKLKVILTSVGMISQYSMEQIKDPKQQKVIISGILQGFKDTSGTLDTTKLKADMDARVKTAHAAAMKRPIKTKVKKGQKLVSADINNLRNLDWLRSEWSSRIPSKWSQRRFSFSTTFQPRRKFHLSPSWVVESHDKETGTKYAFDRVTKTVQKFISDADDAEKETGVTVGFISSVYRGCGHRLQKGRGCFPAGGPHTKGWGIDLGLSHGGKITYEDKYIIPWINFMVKRKWKCLIYYPKHLRDRNPDTTPQNKSPGNHIHASWSNNPGIHYRTSWSVRQKTGKRYMKNKKLALGE